MKGYLIPTIVFISLVGLLIIYVQIGIPQSFLQVQTHETKKESISMYSSAESQNFGFLYFLYMKSDNKNGTNTYNVKIFYPNIQKAEKLADVVIPRDIVGVYPLIRYAKGSFFYQPYTDAENFEPSGEIIAFDLKTGQKNRVINISHPNDLPRRAIEDWLIAKDSIFFLDCIHTKEHPDDTIAAGSSDCKLKLLSLSNIDGMDTVSTLADLGAIFKKRFSIKTIEFYSPQRNVLILTAIPGER